MLAGLLAGLAPAIVSNFFGSAERSLKAYFDKEISKEQLFTELQKALLSAVTEAEKASADAVKATFASYMQAVQTTPLIARCYAAVLLSQLAVLVWVQAGVPWLTWYTETTYPSAGTTIDWAYALVAGLCGLGPLVMKTSLADFKKLVGKGGVS